MQKWIKNRKQLGYILLTSMLLLATPEMVMAATLPTGLSIEGINIEGKTGEEARQLIQDYIQQNLAKKIELNINGKIVTTTCEELGYQCSNIEETLKTIDSYGKGNIIKRYKDSVDLSENPVTLELQANIDELKLETFIQNNSENLGKTAKNASIRRENGKFIITDAVEGVLVDELATKESIQTALQDSNSNVIEVTASVKVGKPAITREDLEGIQDVLGTFTTDYSSSSVARATNIRVGSEKLNGKLLMPGETLSGYEYMNPFTTANGYEIAHAYENGQVVDSVGGGACQIATTLYNAALRAEVEITQRQNHSMTVGYVQPSADAAIAGTYKDIKITNNQDSPIYVEAYTSGRKVTFTIWGDDKRPSNRSLEFVSEVLSNTPAGVTYKDDPSLPAGKTVKESSGHSGRKSKLWKVIKLDGVETDRKLISTDTYMVSNSIVRRGTGVATVPQTPVAPPPQVPESSTQTSISETQATLPPETQATLPPETQAPPPEDPAPPVGGDEGDILDGPGV